MSAIVRRHGGRRVRLTAGAALLLTTVGGCVAEYGPGPGPFPNLNDAEGHLQAAIVSLRQAPPIFGGHKAEAVRLIEAALNEIEMSKASVR